MGKKPVTILERNRLLSRGFYHENSTGRQEDCLKISNVNNYDNQPDIIKRYLVYMELPKIKIGDYHKSSCVVGSLLRFHFLIKIAQNEKIPLVLLPIRDYKVPVVNVAVIHRPFIEDEDAKGPIPKSPGATSPLICYKQDNAGSETPLEKVEDFRKGSAAISKEPGAQVGVSPSTKEKLRDDPISADCWDKGPISKSPGATSPLKRYKQDNAGSETPLEKVEDFRKGSAAISKEPGAQVGVSPSTKEKLRDDPISADCWDKGPISKSPGATSPLKRYKQDNAGSETSLEKVKEDFRKGSAAISKEPGAQVGVSPSTKEKVRDDPISADCWDKGPISKSPGATSPLNRYKQDNAGSETSLEKVKEDFRKGSATISKEPGAQAGVPPSTKQKVQDDPISAEKPKCQKTSSRHRHRNKKRKKYFVYCELPKVAIGDYRIASVISTEIIYCHFIMKIAQDEVRGQPVLRPIKKYHKPRINFAVIHRALIVDDEAAGPIPRSPGIKSPMIRQGADDENDGDEDGDDDGDDDGNTFRGVLHTFIGFNFSAAAPTSKYPLVSQWSLVPDEAGSMTPELVLSKAKG